MKYLAFLLLFLVACTLPQPVTEDALKDTIDEDVAEDNGVELVKEEKEETAKVEVIKADDLDEEIEEVETDSSPITGGVVADYEIEEREAYIGQPPEEEILDITVDTAMDYLVEIFAQDVESYQYIIDMGNVLVRGDKFKILLETPLRYLSKNPETGAMSQDVISTIYVDRSKKTAIGYCEGKDTGLRRECEKNDLLDVPRKLNFLEYNLKLPEDWLWEIFEQTPDAVYVNKYYVNSKKTVRVMFTIDSVPFDMFFDEKNGLPVRIVTVKNGLSIMYDFTDLNANSVKANDVIHRNLGDIPSKEYFK